LQRGRQLTSDLESDRQRLERRTRELERREIQVRTASEISRIISAELNLNILFQKVVDLVKDRFDLYYVGVFINDESNLYTVLQSGTGKAGQNMIAEGHKLAIGGTSMVGWAISRRKARIALDVGQDAIRFENPHLPDTRSELALPMISPNQVIGALSVQSTEPEAFDKNDVLVLQGVADGLATAIENARLFQQTQTNLQEIQMLHQQYLGEAWAEVTSREEGLSYTFENKSKTGADEDIDTSTSLEMPLVLRNQVIGKIKLESDKEIWSEEERSFIDSVTTQATLALENIRLVEETRRAAQHDRILTDITSQVWATSDIDMILQTALQQLGQNLQASDALIRLDASQENGKPEQG
jgi:GAF domain-containing protein